MQLQLRPHDITQHYATLITLHYITTTTAVATATTLQNTTLHYTTLITLHHTTTTNTLPYTRLHYALPYYNTQYTTLHDIDCSALRYTNYTTPRLQLQLRLQIHWLHYITATAPLHYTTLKLQLQLQLQMHYTTLHPAVVVR